MAVIISTSLLIKLFERIPEEIGFSIDDQCGYPNTITQAFGIVQHQLDVLLHKEGILFFKKGQRCYKTDSFDRIKQHFSLLNKAFQVVRYRFKNAKGVQRITMIVSFGNPTVKSEMDHPRRLGADLLREIDAFCALHPIPEYEAPSYPIAVSNKPEPFSTGTITVSTTASSRATTIAVSDQMWSHIISFLEPQPPRLPPESASEPEPQPQQNVSEPFELPHIVTMALQLNFEADPRRKRCSEGTIPLHDGRQLQPKHRRLVVDTLSVMGHDSASLNQKMQIEEAALKLVSYDFGYKMPARGITSILTWKDNQESAVYEDLSSVYDTRHKGRTSKLSELEERRPQYVLDLFRKALVKIGHTASFEKIAAKMAELSAMDEGPNVPGENFPFKTTGVYRWFKARGGKERNGRFEKPVLTDEHIEKRVNWVHTMTGALANKIIVHLDEKWFYCNSRRKSYKILNLQVGEQAGAADIPIRRVVSRQHPTKVMFMGVIGNPDQEHGFDGKIEIVRISEPYQVKKTSYRQTISFDRVVNQALKDGEWRGLFQNIDITTWNIGEMTNAIIDYYELQNDLQGELVFRFNSYKTSGKVEMLTTDCTKRLSTYNRRTLDGSMLPAHLEVVELHIKMIKGSFIEKDCSCDSDFMLRTLPQVGQKIRQAYHWLPADESIYLQMDNAGGHGTKVAIEEYTQNLRENFNIVIVHQPPRSPDTNVLDLGLWNAIQSRVDETHRTRTIQAESLAESTKTAWAGLPIQTITNVFGKLPNIWEKIIESGGQEVA